MNLKFLYTDDKTGLFSDTTLRTWILFAVFIVYTLFLCVIHVLVIAGKLVTPVSPQILDSAISLFDALGVAVFGGGFLYFAKRVNERKAGLFNPDSEPEKGKTSEEDQQK